MLQKKFQSCFSKNPQLRILFFFDEGGDYLEEIRQMPLNDIRIAEFDGRWLHWKIELNREQHTKTVLYFQRKRPETQDERLNFPLLDLLMSNRELRLDNVAEFMDTYQLQLHQQSLVSLYMVELQKPDVQRTLSTILNPTAFKETLQLYGNPIEAAHIVSVYGFEADYEYLPDDDLAWEVVKALIDNPGERADNRLKRLFTMTNEAGFFRHVVTFLHHVLEMNTRIKAQRSVQWDTPDDYVERYTGALHFIDFYYRKAVFEYHQTELQDTPIEERLHKDEKNVSTLTSITTVGMANLLPGKSFTYIEDDVRIDGEKTKLLEQRERILQKQNPKSKAVSYETITKNDKQQNRELFKAEIVYVYHNVIDREGHHGTERNTFEAVRRAIDELSRLVKLILGGYGVTKVIITSDHGFLYHDTDIVEADKNEPNDTEIIHSGARYYISHSHTPPSTGYKMPLFRTSPFQEPYYVAVPDEQVKDIIRNNYVHRAEAETIKSRIGEKGRYRIIDKVSVELNDKSLNQYEATFANLSIRDVPIADAIVQHNPKLLSGNGVWCVLTVAYNHVETARVRWEIEDVKPIQIASVDIDEFLTKRANFTAEEWINLMIHSIGLKPDNLNRRDKLILLARLLPHVENNFNFMELGPKGTGKSHVYQELSLHGILVSGGDVTSARLFVRHSVNRELLGLIGYWDVVAWDEYEHQPGKRFDPVMIDTMQNYLDSKSFNRGKGTHEASASMAFIGNTKHTVPYMLKNSHLFESIPEAFIKSAFLDRIHLYNPGWEVRILKKASFSDGFGFITDYLAELLHELRNQDFSPVIRNYVKFDPSLTERDHTSIRKTFSGMMKLLYPHRQVTPEELLELIDFAVEGRKRVKDKLYILDETFRAERAIFDYQLLSTSETIPIETLETLSGSADVPTAHLSSLIFQESSFAPTSHTSPKRPRIPQNPMLSLTIRENQTGISYEKLFSEYVREATEITIEDPYIRFPYQIRNLMEFISLIIKLNKSDNPIKVHLITWNTVEFTPTAIEAFDEIQASLEETGINFTYEFKEFQDRTITTNTGWKIILGRGLDIFEPRKGFSIDDLIQEKRRCKGFNYIEVRNQEAGVRGQRA